MTILDVEPKIVQNIKAGDTMFFLTGINFIAGTKCYFEI